MRKFSKQELDEIIYKHGLWIENNEKGERANLAYTNLQNVNLCGVNLGGAYLRAADLTGANLSGACLVSADLIGVNLLSANLHGANLCEADLSFANLRFATLDGANLSCANLNNTDFDYSVFYLCNGINVHVDDKQAIQALYHLLKNVEFSKNTSATLKRLCKKKYLKKLVSSLFKLEV